jgi:cardiolipin synthase
VTSGNRVELLQDPYRALLAMQESIEAARYFIHLEYYIIRSDEVTRQLFEHLLSAAKRGVEIRILYDSLGSLSLKRIYFRKLLQKGVKIAGFLPFSLFPQRMNVNFRNHRKILLVDGHTAFTGGTNIGRQYLGRRNEGQWHDYSVKVSGPACAQLQDVFAKDWHFTTQEDLLDPKYYPQPKGNGDSVIQVLESGPDASFLSLHQALFLALNSAREEILLTTPYFVPDPAITTSLMVAARRGVKVMILLPLKSDSRLVQYASRSFFDELLRAGVNIFEYTPRILHAKCLVIDKKWTILGSANMDIRSFRLNFELNLLVYGPSVAEQATSLFETDLQHSRQVDLRRFLARPLGQQMIENACRLLSPVL